MPPCQGGDRRFESDRGRQMNVDCAAALRVGGGCLARFAAGVAREGLFRVLGRERAASGRDRRGDDGMGPGMLSV